MLRATMLILLTLPLIYPAHAADPPAATRHAATRHAATRHAPVRHDSAAHAAATRASPKRLHAAHRVSPKQPSAVATRAPSGTSAAPTPDQDVRPPPIPEDKSAHVAPTVFKLNNSFPGDGYVYGSSPQGMDDRRAAMVPGLSLSVPLR